MTVQEMQRCLSVCRVGAWYTYCCYLDFYEIETEEHAAEIRKKIQDCIDENFDDGSCPTVWPSERDGLIALLRTDSMTATINARLAEIDGQ